MRCMVIVKANKDFGGGCSPNTEILTAMGKFNAELVKAGVMLTGDGLHPSSKGVRVRFSGRTSKPCWLAPSPTQRSSSPASGCGRCDRWKKPSNGSSVLPSRTVRSKFARSFEPEDLGVEFTPELRQQEERQRAQIVARR